MGKRQGLIAVVLVFLVVLGGFSWLLLSEENLTRISISVNATLLAGVFLATAFYARHTQRIADETKNMATQTLALAQEAKAQRQRDFLPIIDIVAEPAGQELIKIGLLKDQGEIPNAITCRLSNVGRGPAFNLTYLAEHSGGQFVTLVQSTFLVGYSMTSVLEPQPSIDGGKRSHLSLGVETDSDGITFVKVTYQDVFGSKWSSRKILSGNADILGALEFGSETTTL